MRSKICTVAVAVTALILSMPGTVAHAAVPGRYVEAVDRVTQPGYSSVVYTECAQGGSLTGGGFFFGSTTNLDMSGNHPARPERPIWWTGVDNYTPWAQPTTTYGVCAAVNSHVSGGASRTVQAGQQAGITISCPAGTTATGGGYSRNRGMVVDISRPAGTGWYIHAYNPTTGPLNVHTSTMCTAVSATVVTSSFTVGAGSGWDTVATCPAGRMSLGGGWAFAPVAGLIIDISRPSTFSQGWHVHAFNTTAVARTVTAYATCA